MSIYQSTIRSAVNAGAGNVKDDGAQGNDSANDTTAINATLTAEGAKTPDGAALVPAGIYRSQGLSVPEGVTVFGVGDNSVLKKRANGAVMTLGKSAHMRDVRIDGVGATYTGVGVTIPATVEFEGSQRLSNLTILDTASYCVEYSAEYAGYGSVIFNCQLKPTSISTHSVKWGVETASNHHGDRSIIGCNSSYSPLVDATGSQAGVIAANIAGGLGAQAVTLDSNSAKIAVLGNRFGSTGQTQVIDGSLHAWVGNITVGDTVFSATSDVCTYAGNLTGDITITAGGDGHSLVGNVCADVSIASSGNVFSGNRASGTITLASGATSNVVQGNYGTVVDNSGSVGSSANMVDIKPIAFTPTWTTAGGTPNIGASALTGLYSRNGRTVHVTIRFIIDATAPWNPGTGAWFFALPFTPNSIEQCGAAKILDNGTTHYIGMCQSTTSTRMQVYADSAVVGAAAPLTWATGDIVSASLTYDI